MSWGNSYLRRQAKPRRSAPKMDQRRRSDADKNCMLGFGTASRLLVAWSSSLFVVLMTKLSRCANGVVSVRPELKCTTPSLRFFSFRPNCPNALLLAPRVRGARSHSLTRHASSVFSVRCEQKRAQAFCHQNRKAASACGAEGASSVARCGVWFARRNWYIQKCWP